jgi:hypothetical protein
MVIIRRPMKLKILQKYSPIECQTMLFEIPDWERKAVVYAHYRRGFFGQNFC